MSIPLKTDLEEPPNFYQQEAYLVTSTGIKISKKQSIKGIDAIHTHGKTIIQEWAIIRADLASIKLGKYTTIGESAIIHPPYRKTKG